MTAAVAGPEMTLQGYLDSQREAADPKMLLDLVLAENERIKANQAAREHEYKIASEVKLDERGELVPENMAQLFRVARMYYDSGFAPEAYLKAGVPGIAIGLRAARKCRVDDLTFLQHSFPHKGKIGIDSQLAIAMLIRSGKIQGRPKYSMMKDGQGKVVSCTCTVTDSETGETHEQTVTWEMVEAEGWHLANGSQKSKWVTLRELMFQYRAGIFVSRVHYPDVMQGMYTTEELADIEVAGRAPSMTIEDLGERLGEAEASRVLAESKPKKKPAKQPKPAEPIETKPAASDLPAEAAAPPEKPPLDSKSDSAKEPEAAKEPEKAPKPAPAATSPTKGLGRPQIVSFLKSRFGEQCDGFNLEAIAAAAEKSPNWSMFCKQVIEKKALGWESYLLESAEDQEAVQAEGQEAEGQDNEQLDDSLPECVTDPVARPANPDPVVAKMEEQILSYKQAKRIRDMASGTIKNNPGLSNDEAAYLLDLCERQAWYRERGENPPREHQIPG